MVALEAERRQRDPPPLAHAAQPHRVGDAHVGEEHLVERSAAAHLLDRAHLDPGQVHRDDEGRHALVLGHVDVGAGDQLAPGREQGAGAPDLLPVDDPLVAVTDGPAAQVRQVGAGAGLGEQLAAQLSGGEERRHVLRLLLVGAPRHDRGRDEAGRDAVGLVRAGAHVLALEAGERLGVLAGVAEAAVGDRRGDGVVPALGLEPGPRLRPLEQRPLLVGLERVEDGDAELALAPHELLVVRGDGRCGVLVQPGPGVRDERLEAGDRLTHRGVLRRPARRHSLVVRADRTLRKPRRSGVNSS